MKTIPLTHGMSAIVDDEDYDWLNQWKWYAVKGQKSWYAKRTVYLGGEGYKCIRICMHREILSLKIGDQREGDHKNNNGLDNQRHNLRICTSSQNKMNTGLRSDNTSGFKGVNWHKATRRWRARIKANGREIFLGGFDNRAEAAEAYRNHAAEYHGEFARLE